MARNHGLKLSLLVSLGLLPLACGATTTRGNADDSSGESRGSTGGTDPITTGAGGSGTSGTGVVVGGGAPARLGTCTAGVVDPVSGLVKCQEGFEHRPKAVACEAVGGAPADFEAGGAGGEPSLSGCITDTDCDAGFVCACNGYTSHGGECQRSYCRTDADCPGSLCASYHSACGESGFVCITQQDQCVTDEDCAGARCHYGFIVPGGGTNIAFPARVCDNAICGRPFLVDSAARVAEAVSSCEWLDGRARKPRVEQLTSAERAAHAAHWTRLGQLEHASIAAFARFQLQLLALGAPPELVEGCTQALADETAHAVLCFGIASAYAGRDIGPGPLDISGSLTPTALAEVVELVIAEGCFGETSAALEALEAADSASDPVIVAAYARIAEDEQRHAELAFRFVRWAMAQDANLVEQVQSVLLNERAVAPSVRDIVEACLYGMLNQRAAA